MEKTQTVLFPIIFDDLPARPVEEISYEHLFMKELHAGLGIKVNVHSALDESPIISYAPQRYLSDADFFLKRIKDQLLKYSLIETLTANRLSGPKDALLCVKLNCSLSNVLRPRGNWIIESLLDYLSGLVASTSRHRITLVVPELSVAQMQEISQILDRHECSQAVRVFDDLGNSTDVIEPEVPKRIATYHLNAGLPHLVTRFTGKLVKVPGHFRRISGNVAHDGICQEDFYTARYCGREIVLFVESILIKENVEAVVYHAPYSRWLQGALNIVRNKHPHLKVLELYDDSIDLATLSCKILLLHDIVHSGRTLLESLTYVTGLAPAVPLCVATVLSVNSVHERLDYSLALVDQDFYIGDMSTCPLCIKGVTIDDMLQDKSNGHMALSASRFWRLCDLAGFGPELQYPAKRRKPIPQVPNFKLMMDMRGQYLAHLSKEMIAKRTNIMNPSECIFVSPDEHPSESFALMLQRMFGITVVRINRDDLDALSIKSDNGDIQESDMAEFEWFKIIRKEGKRRCVIFDEFCTTTSTFEIMRQIIGAMKLQIAAFLVIANFADVEDDYKEIPVVSLYKLPMIFSKPQRI